MVNPNAVGNKNTDAVSEPNLWEGLGDVKMGAAAVVGEKIENNKNSIVAKFHERLAQKAVKKAKANYDDTAAKRHEAEIDAKEATDNKRVADERNHDRYVEYDFARQVHDEAKRSYNDKKKEASTGEYLKDQAKQVKRILAAGGSFLKQALGNAWSKDAESAVAKLEAKDRLRDSVDGFIERREDHQQDVKEKKTAANALKLSEKELKNRENIFENDSKNYDKAVDKYNATFEKIRKLRAEMDQIADDLAKSKEELRKAEGEVRIAKEVRELRKKLGNTDIEKVEAQLSEREAAGIVELETVKQLYGVVEEYRALKKKQALKVAKSRNVKEELKKYREAHTPDESAIEAVLEKEGNIPTNDASETVSENEKIDSEEKEFEGFYNA